MKVHCPHLLTKPVFKITSFHVNQNDIWLIIKTLDPRIAHGFDNNSVKLRQICDEILLCHLVNIWNSIERKRISRYLENSKWSSSSQKDEKNIFSKIFQGVI